MKFNWKSCFIGSLQVRVAVMVLSIFMVGIWFLLFYFSEMQRKDTMQLLGEQQHAMTEYIALEIDQELQDRFKALEKIAALVSTDVLTDEAAVQQQLQQLKVFQQLFNGGAFVTDIHGVAVASVPVAANRLGISYLDRDYIARAIKQGKASVGRPVMGRALHSPIFGMAAPIRNQDGDIIGALAGITDLGKSSFLDHITMTRSGAQSYVLLVDMPSRLIITSTNKNRLMEPLPAPGKNWLIDKYLAGEEQTGIMVDSSGEEVLSSAKIIDSTSWYVAAAIPASQVFAPVYQKKQQLILITMLLTLLVALLTWWVVRYQLHPIHTAVRHLAGFSDKHTRILPLKISRRDEIGVLFESFNQLLNTLAQRESVLVNNEKKLMTILDNVNAAIFLKDVSNRYLFANRHVREFFGKTMADIVGQTDEIFFAPASVEHIRANDQQVLLDGKTVHTEEDVIRLADGKPRTFLTTKIPLRNEAGKIYALCGISTDITDRKRLEEEIRQQALFDHLTKLPNRRLLVDRLDQAIAASKRSGLYCAVLFLDIDNFKLLNDAYGHQVGDDLLIAAARRLTDCVRESDTVARLGGDEFVVMISELDGNRQQAQAMAEVVANKILRSLSAPYNLAQWSGDAEKKSVSHVCTVSIGICLFSGNALDREDILNRADMAMYEVKQAGRNQIRFFAAETA
jgi:diguanylate cyclase (GGDEF)-like protein/PAS domain S-box-containing protein